MNNTHFNNGANYKKTKYEIQLFILSMNVVSDIRTTVSTPKAVIDASGNTSTQGMSLMPALRRVAAPRGR